jgi:PAS domain-containing protein
MPDPRLQANEALRGSEERYRVLFALSPVAVYSVDASGAIQEFNRVAAELWGREPPLGDTGQRFCGSFKLYRPDGSFMPRERCPMAQVVSGEILEARNEEVLIERPDGSRVNVIINIRPLVGPDGDITGAINCFYDVTERARIERERRQHAEALADLNRLLGEAIAED